MEVSVSARPGKRLCLLDLQLERPHIEYWVQFGDTYYKNGMEVLEQMQRRTTKMVQGLDNRPGEEWLRELQLFSVEKRLRGDFLTVHSYLRGWS